MRRPSLLLADDDTGLRKILERCFTQFGFTVHSVASTEELFLASQGGYFDAYLIDLHLDGWGAGSAWDALQIGDIRVRERLFVMTGDPGASQRDLVKGCPTGILLKPFDVFDIAEKMQENARVLSTMPATERRSR